ncbi:exo-beta-N-acetylmuramidase NamZ family protein [Salisediminibacterium beveridgei]|uniref:DUF1343 domain-containing protein n=1 Tax=Salisediminibacterium beveridgei TaxID=632773 RepID=A0A1D7QZQ8_9BACI|nr:DUF1343 domain-containing protein [Salisediminibacterium beveridgei]AOM84493.1 hypothetical protein BBEV_3178 [Salisediminibacterium beveridgei]
MKIGLDLFLEKDYLQFKDQRIGLVTNMTGVNQGLVPAIDLFHNHPDIQLTSLYCPEHGLRGDMKEGENVDSYTDPFTHLPVYSLYGNNRKPTEEMLDRVDVLVFDLQDIGSRYYTFIYTLAYVMEASEQYGKQVVVLDRPNPVSGLNMEGNLVEDQVRSFVGLLPIPNRHGMTVGELAQLYKHEFGYDCALTVVPMEGWRREMYYDDTGLFWVSPSPNVTNSDMNTLYTGTCLIEGTNLSEGRGTTRPFEVVGAPFIDGHQLAKAFNRRSVPGVLARPTSFIPSYQKHEGEICGGVQLHLVNRQELHSLATGIYLLETIAELYQEEFEFIVNEENKFFFDLLAGTTTLRNLILNQNAQEFIRSCEDQVESFKQRRKPYLLYR